MSAPKGLDGVFTYVTRREIAYKAEGRHDLTPSSSSAWTRRPTPAAAWRSASTPSPATRAGWCCRKRSATPTASTSWRLRKAVFGLSGKLKTLDGTFELDDTGAQIGEITPLGQVAAGRQGRHQDQVVYPHGSRDRKAEFGKLMPLPLLSACGEGSPAQRSRRAVLRPRCGVLTSADPRNLRGAGVRPLLHPGRPRAEPGVRRHAHRQPRAWRLPDAGRLRGVLAVHAVRPASAGRRRAACWWCS